MSTTKELLTGYGEEKDNAPKAGDADLWIKIWEELLLPTSKEKWVEVEHVKAHRTEKDKKEMSHMEKLITDGNEKGTSWQRQEQCRTKDSWRKREQRQSSKREEVCAALQCAASFHCLIQKWKD